jgi:chromate transporter
MTFLDLKGLSFMNDTFQELPGAWKLLRIWGKIGLQSFGGGATTTLLIQRAFIDEGKWMTMEDFTRYWSLCVFTPGINLVALTVLIGRRFAGTRGIIASLVGMLLPSAFITCLLTAGFQLIKTNHNVQAMLKGIIPATAGIMLLVGLNFAYPQIKQAYKEGLFSLSASIILMLACAVAIIVFKLSVIPVLLVTALLGMLLFTSWRVKTVVQQGIAQEEEEPIHD